MQLTAKMKAASLAKLVPLGDFRKVYTVELTEPEINAIHAAFGFLQGASVVAMFKGFADHYGPTMKALSERLGAFDDGNAEVGRPDGYYWVSHAGGSSYIAEFVNGNWYDATWSGYASEPPDFIGDRILQPSAPLVPGVDKV